MTTLALCLVTLSWFLLREIDSLALWETVNGNDGAHRFDLRDGCAQRIYVNDATEQKYKKRDDASTRLGEKMLQGWTLLGMTCPTEGCFTPFVRNKQGQMYCVSCEQFAVTEEQANKEREQQQQRDDELAEQQEAQQERERELVIAQRFRDDEQRKAAAAEQQRHERQRTAEQPNGTTKRKSEQVPLSATGDSDRVKTLRHHALAALYEKVEALTNSLGAHDHSERLVAVAKTIRELTEAIKTLEQ